MARLSLYQNKKFKRLVLRLGLPRPYVRGLLDTMWDSAHESADPILGDRIGVEAAAEWPGEPGRLCEALQDERFLDLREDGQYACHDYWENCPRYVRRRVARRREDAVEASYYNGRPTGAQRATTDRPMGDQRAPKSASESILVDPPAGARSRPVPSRPVPEVIDLSPNVGGDSHLAGDSAAHRSSDDQPMRISGRPRRHTNPPAETDLLVDYETEVLNKLDGTTNGAERKDRPALLLAARHAPRSIVHAALEATQDARLHGLAGENEAVNHAAYFTAAVKRHCLAAGIASPFAQEGASVRASPTIAT